MNSRKIISTFRTELYVQMALVLLLSGAGAWYVVAAFGGRLGVWAYVLAAVILLTGVALLAWAYLKPLYRLEMDAQGIRRRHVLGGAEQYYPLDGLESIETGVHQIENANGPLTEAVPEMSLRFKGGRSFDISPRIYGNFFDLGMFVVQQYNRRIDDKIEELARYLLIKKLANHGKQREQNT